MVSVGATFQIRLWVLQLIIYKGAKTKEAMEIAYADGTTSDLDQPHRCGLCRKPFRQKSSLVRHAKKCTLEPRLSLRQKACRACTSAKARCDLERPNCSRCAARGVECAYMRPSPTPSTPTPITMGLFPQAHARAPPAQPSAPGPGPGPGPGPDRTALYAADSGAAGPVDGGPVDFSGVRDGTITPGWLSNISSSEDGLDLALLTHQPHHQLGATHIGGGGSLTPFSGLHPAPLSPSPDDWMLAIMPRPVVPDTRQLVQHSMRTIFRVLRSWPRMLAKGFQLPPIMHFSQFKSGTLRPLANCIALCKMWSGQCEGTGPIVVDAVRKEMDNILCKYQTYDKPTLLGAFQSMILYLLLLIFPTPTQVSQSLIPPPLLTQVQAMGYYVAATGLLLPEEARRIRPGWAAWAHVEAKRRAMCSLYLVHWAYSVYHHEAQIHFDCRELGRTPGPGAKFLWAAADEAVWSGLYNRWLAQWDGKDFLFAEFTCVDSEIVMNRRAEIWLEDADELGFLLLSLVNATERSVSQIQVIE
ncbi:hypothetical protein BX600DRAFT_270749 [Xylariales sp. PMI_506]|nr:hypothetical protein BX600DRAFT_270749 [Xylariales sp. PMI_506]